MLPLAATPRLGAAAARRLCQEGRARSDAPAAAAARLRHRRYGSSASKNVDQWGNPLYGSWQRSGKAGLDNQAAAVAKDAGAPAARPPAAPPPPAAVGKAKGAATDLTIEQDVINSGSTARDHLANERTFLAWARTGVGFVALGVGLAQIDQAKAPSPPPPPPAIVERARKRGGAVDEADAVDKAAWGSTRGGGGTALPQVMLVGVGGMFLSYATWRYFQVQDALLRGTFPVNRVGVRVRIPISRRCLLLHLPRLCRLLRLRLHLLALLLLLLLLLMMMMLADDDNASAHARWLAMNVRVPLRCTGGGGVLLARHARWSCACV